MVINRTAPNTVCDLWSDAVVQQLGDLVVFVPDSLKLLQEACERFGYEFFFEDDDSYFLAHVSNGVKHYFPSASKIPIYPLNLANSAELANDKAYTYRVLEARNIPVVHGASFCATNEYKKYGLNSFEDALKWASHLGYPVFVKPNRGSQGRGGDVCHNQNDLILHAQKISEIDYLYLVQKFETAREFRCFCLDGEILFSYERLKPHVTGDGSSTIEQLIAERNQRMEMPTQKVDPNSVYLSNVLSKKGVELSSVLSAGQRSKFLQLPTSRSEENSQG